MLFARAWSLFAFVVALVACGGEEDTAPSPSGSSGSSGSSSGSSSGGSSSGGSSSGGCATSGNTTATATTPTGCAVLARDASACRAEREALGLSGVWLKLSCRVTLGVSNGSITAKADGQPDYRSFYFAPSNACYEAYAGATKNPNQIAALDLTLTFPAHPTTSGSKMRGATVGIALNGVPIFGNFAAPGDDIYQEALTFDRCAGHPQKNGVYHYHAEPLSLTYDDANLVGVLLDGYPVYGRRDADGTMPALDSDGGHVGTTAESPTTPVYHYHVNEQTSTGPRTGGEKQWFLTKGTWHGTAGTCTGTGC